MKDAAYARHLLHSWDHHLVKVDAEWYSIILTDENTYPSLSISIKLPAAGKLVLGKITWIIPFVGSVVIAAPVIPQLCRPLFPGRRFKRQGNSTQRWNGFLNFRQMGGNLFVPVDQSSSKQNAGYAQIWFQVQVLREPHTDTNQTILLLNTWLMEFWPCSLWCWYF